MTGRLAGLKCTSSKGQQYTSSANWYFQGYPDLYQELAAADRTLMCVYTTELGESFFGSTSDAGSHERGDVVLCPAFPLEEAADGLTIIERISVVADGLPGALPLNLTTEPCRPDRGPSTSELSLLAWLEPPVALCGLPAEHSLHV